MQFIKPNQLMPKLAILFGVWLVLVALNFARANEGAEAPKEGGEVAAGPSAEQKASNQDFAEYNKHINKMSQLNGKIDEGQKQIQQLLVQKKMGVATVKSEKGPPEDIINVITRAHKEYLDNREKYNSELREVTYRFPSRGQEIRRKYHPFRPKTVSEIEGELGLDGQLSDLKIKVQEKYQVFNPIKKAEVVPEPERKQGGERTPASVDDPGRVRLVVPASPSAHDEKKEVHAKKPTHH